MMQQRRKDRAWYLPPASMGDASKEWQAAVNEVADLLKETRPRMVIRYESESEMYVLADGCRVPRESIRPMATRDRA